MDINNIFNIFKPQARFVGHSGQPFLHAEQGEVLLSVDEDGHFCLPHQCDKWIIGDIEQVKKLRDDLQLLIEIYE